MNKYEQVSTDHHQMPLAGWRVSVPRPDIPGEGKREGGRGLVPRSDVWGEGVTYLVTYPMMHLMLPNTPPSLLTDRQTDTCENITFPQLRLQAVKMWSATLARTQTPRNSTSN